jgi:hypothetical protein
MKEVSQLLAQNLAYLRKLRGLSQEQLASTNFELKKMLKHVKTVWK